jgi:hypothetical protein
MQLLCFLIGTNYEPVLLHAVYKLVSYIVYHAVDSNLMKCTTNYTVLRTDPIFFLIILNINTGHFEYSYIKEKQNFIPVKER